MSVGHLYDIVRTCNNLILHVLFLPFGERIPRLKIHIGGTRLKRNVEITQDVNGTNIVIIHDIRFKGKRNIDWNEVEEYLKQYVGTYYEIIESSDKVYIGSDFPDEYTGSKDTARLKGTLAKAKANAAIGIGELLMIAENKEHVDNRKEKHKEDAKYGWYRYFSRFALPVYATDNYIERYNIFHVQMIVRHDRDGKKYLYDLINIKKESSTPHCL